MTISRRRPGVGETDLDSHLVHRGTPARSQPISRVGSPDLASQLSVGYQTDYSASGASSLASWGSNRADYEPTEVDERAPEYPKEVEKKEYPNWEYIKKTVLDRKAFFFGPMTQRKAKIWGTELSLLGGVGVTQYFTNQPWNTCKAIVSANILPYSIIGYSFEPILSIASMIFSPYPNYLIRQPMPALLDKGKKIIEDDSDLSTESSESVDLEAQPVSRINPKNRRLAVVIPEYNGSNVVAKTVEAALKVVGPERIIVVINGSRPEEARLAKQYIREINPNVIVFQDPKGNKNEASLTGCIIAAALPASADHDQVEEVMLIDNDVPIPAHFVSEIDKCLKDEAGLRYPIVAAAESGTETWLTDCMKLEFGMNDTFNAFMGIFRAGYYPHGAVAVYKLYCLIAGILKKLNLPLERFEKQLSPELFASIKNGILELHNGVFQAEDCQYGFQGEWLGLKLRDGHYLIPTYSPEVLRVLFQQRVFSWNFGYNNVINLQLRNFALSWMGPIPFVAFRKPQGVYNVITHITDALYFPLTAMALANPDVNRALYIARWIAPNALSIANALIYNYWHIRKFPELQARHWYNVILYATVYSFLQKVFTALGQLYYFTEYLPKNAPRKSLGEYFDEGRFNEVLRAVRLYIKPHFEFEPFDDIVKLPRFSDNPLIRLFSDATIEAVPVRASNKDEIGKQLVAGAKQFNNRALMFSSMQRYVASAVVGVAILLVLMNLFINWLTDQPLNARKGYTNIFSMCMSLFAVLSGILMYNLSKASNNAYTNKIITDIQISKIGFYANSQPKQLEAPAPVASLEKKDVNVVRA